MARTGLTAISMPASYGVTPSTLTFTAGDAVNGNSVALTGREILIVRNTDGASAHTVTVSSVSCPHSRTGNATKSVPASGFVIFQNFPTMGWQQSDGKLYIDVDDAQLELAVVKLP